MAVKGSGFHAAAMHQMKAIGTVKKEKTNWQADCSGGKC